MQTEIKKVNIGYDYLKNKIEKIYRLFDKFYIEFVNSGATTISDKGAKIPIFENFNLLINNLNFFVDNKKDEMDFSNFLFLNKKINETKREMELAFETFLESKYNHQRNFN